MAALLDVHDLRVSFDTPDGVVNAVNGLSFSVDAGQTLGIVGESGSGKSVSTQTVVGLIRGATVTGEAFFEDLDLLRADENELREVRGGQIGMIFQDPLTSLHPLYTVGWQITELIHEHDRGIARKAAKKRAADLLALVGIPNAGRRVDDYPHQFSGGMRQRVMIAMATAMNPRLLIADEPTTALDVTVQAQVLRVMHNLQAEFGTAIIMITHDLGVIADIADEIVVMYAGSVMERADRRTLFYDYHHPYTEGLLASLPVAGERKRLTPIAGQPPSLINLPAGCPFRLRCRYAFDRCATEKPPLRAIPGADQHQSACWLDVSREDRAARRRSRAAEAVQSVAQPEALPELPGPRATAQPDVREVPDGR